MSALVRQIVNISVEPNWQIFINFAWICLRIEWGRVVDFGDLILFSRSQEHLTYVNFLHWCDSFLYCNILNQWVDFHKNCMNISLRQSKSADWIFVILTPFSWMLNFLLSLKPLHEKFFRLSRNVHFFWLLDWTNITFSVAWQICMKINARQGFIGNNSDGSIDHEIQAYWTRLTCKN